MPCDPPSTTTEPSTRTLRGEFLRFQCRILSHQNGAPVTVDGQNLSIAEVIAVARHAAVVRLTKGREVHARVNAAHEIVQNKLSEGKSVYGISTGFGGSADTRTSQASALGHACLQHLHIGVLPFAPDRGHTPRHQKCALTISSDALSNTMPESWVRAAILVRMNSLLRGHSGVRWEFVSALNELLRENITPVVPLRGTVSSSGDLAPLSYIAGTLVGNPRIRVFDGPFPSCASDTPNSLTLSSRTIVPCTQAYADHDMQHIAFEGKEYLGALNGTSFSAAVASLALGDASQMGMIAMVCTAMGTEALLGTQASHAKFIHETARPHPGQIEVAQTIRSLLRGSSLATIPQTADGAEEERTIAEDEGRLRQDRYALRTAPQFLGPQIEDILSALERITMECNSTTDNPLVNPASRNVHHGGNFQAMAVTNSMESVRLALSHIGRILFAQMTELLNPLYNRGLPPSLAASNPSVDYFGKGLDTAAASYVSELGFLAGNVSTHIQSAEMHNQAVNSLALISARATVTALDVLAMLVSSYLYVLCQALDLRALQHEQFGKMKQVLREEVWNHLRDHISTEKALEALCSHLAPTMRDALAANTTKDAERMMESVAAACTAPMLESLGSHLSSDSPELGRKTISSADLLTSVAEFRASFVQKSAASLQDLRKLYLENSGKGSECVLTSQLLADGTRPVYDFIRNDLGIGLRGRDNFCEFKNGFEEPLIGDDVSRIYESIRSGTMAGVLVKVLGKATD